MSEPEIIFIPDPNADGDFASLIEAAADLLIGLGEAEGDSPQDTEGPQE